jgi:hypothetical protein
MKKNCIIAAVGKESLHRQWLDINDSEVDLHLIIYDDSFEKYKSDTPFIKIAKGNKFQLIYAYLTDEIINRYDYFYMPDDDISIDQVNVKRLFKEMKRYGLSIGQPAISNQYYTFPHTSFKKGSKIRFTSFVEIMQPCFSKSALEMVKSTFAESISGWGIDFHWGILVDYEKYNMGILDCVRSEHTRPILSQHNKELSDYMLKYNLSYDIYSTGCDDSPYKI